MHFIRKLACVLLLAPFLLNGCGGGDDGSPPAQTNTGAPPPPGGQLSGGNTTTPPATGGNTVIVPPTTGSTDGAPSTGGNTSTPPATGGNTATPPATGGNTPTPPATGGAGPGAGGSTAGNGSGGNGSSVTPTTANTSRFLYLIARPNDGEPHIEAYTIDAATGALASNGAITGRDSSNSFPSSLAVDPSSKFLYAIQGITITGYSIDGVTGRLSSTGTSSVAPYYGGVAMAFIPSGRFAYVVHAGGEDPKSSVSAYSVNAATGALSQIAGSPFAAGLRTWSIAIDRSGRFAYVTNAETNNVLGYAIDAANGTLTTIGQIAAGTRPDFVAVDPSGKFAYITNSFSNDISAYTIDSTTGLLTSIGPAFAADENPISIAITPSGKFAYVTHEPIPANGGQGPTSGYTNSILAYSRDTTTGVLTNLGPARATGSGRAMLTIEASGKFAYVTNTEFGNVSAYSIDATTGALTEIAGSPFATGILPVSIVFAGQ